MSNEANDGVTAFGEPPEPVFSESPTQKECQHSYAFHTHGWYRTETYKCTKCGHLMERRWYEYTG